MIKKARKIRQRYVPATAVQNVFLMPAMIFMSAAVILVLAPQVFVYVLASIFLFIAVSLAYISYIAIKAKKHIDKFIKMGQGKVFVHDVSVYDEVVETTIEDDEIVDPEKKILYH